MRLRRVLFGLADPLPRFVVGDNNPLVENHLHQTVRCPGPVTYTLRKRTFNLHRLFPCPGYGKITAGPFGERQLLLRRRRAADVSVQA